MRELRIVLARGGGRVRGRVIDGQGQPVPGAGILVGETRRKLDRQHDDGSWVAGPPPVELRADAEGRFRCAGLELGNVPIGVRARGLAPWTGEVEAVAFEPRELTIRLERGAVVHGCVRDTDGRGVGYALVEAGDRSTFVGAVVIVLLKAQRREGTDPTCGRCGYNLTGSESNRCPECGTLFIEAGVTLGNPAPKRARWVLVSLIVLSILFVAGIGLSLSYRAASQAQAQAAQAQLLRMRATEMQAALLKEQQHK